LRFFLCHRYDLYLSESELLILPVSNFVEKPTSDIL